MFLAASNLDELYTGACRYVWENGERCEPRGLPTVEVRGAILKLSNPRARLLQNPVRNISVPFAIAEWLWCMQGLDDLELIQYYAPSYARFSDDGQTLYGAYGPRILAGLDHVLTLLQKDPATRRAVLPLYTPQDVGRSSKDIPCTTSLHFLIRQQRLELCVHMRSNDLFLGLPYDVFNFTMLQEYVANVLQVELGSYTHTVNSLHYYLRHEQKIGKIAVRESEKALIMPPMPREELAEKLNELFEAEREMRSKRQRCGTLESSFFQKLANELQHYQQIVELKGV